MLLNKGKCKKNVRFKKRKRTLSIKKKKRIRNRDLDNAVDQEKKTFINSHSG